MMKLKKTKKGDLISGELIALILVIITVALVLLLLFKVDLLRLIKNSSYTYEGDKLIDETEMTHLQIANLCPVQIGKIKNINSWKWLSNGFIFSCTDATCVDFVQTKLFVDGTNKEAAITVDQKINDKIGSVSGNWIDIDDTIIQREGKLFSGVVSDLPNEQFVRELDGAYILSGNLLCREKAIKKIEISGNNPFDEANLPVEWTKVEGQQENVYRDAYLNTIYLEKNSENKLEIVKILSAYGDEKTGTRKELNFVFIEYFLNGRLLPISIKSNFNFLSKLPANWVQVKETEEDLIFSDGNGHLVTLAKEDSQLYKKGQITYILDEKTGGRTDYALAQVDFEK